MLDNLLRTVEKLRERVRGVHREWIGNYEIRTRASLIDPMLHALGWEVGDPAQVRLEKVTEAGRPDYALLGQAGNPVLLIEAKKLSDPRPPWAQVVSYVTAENIDRPYKVPYCAWTNGDVWQVFDVLFQNRVLEASLSEELPADCAFKLLGLWRTSLLDGSLRIPVTLSPRKGGPAKKPTEQLNRCREAGEHRDGHTTTLANFNAQDEPMPTSIAFPGEAARPLSTQKELLVSVANWLVKTGRLTTGNGTLPSGHKRYIVHTSPKHPSGKNFVADVELDNGLHLETSNRFGQTVEFAKKLLDHCGVSELAERIKLGR